MPRARLLAVLFVALAVASTSWAADPLHSTTGMVVKSNAEVLMMRPRGADGRFEKAVPFKVRGTSKVTVFSLQKRAGQVVPVQREIEVKDLQADQTVSVIYTIVGDEYVLLSAVALPVKGEK
jgi:hypothetical protein